MRLTVQQNLLFCSKYGWYTPAKMIIITIILIVFCIFSLFNMLLIVLVAFLIAETKYWTHKLKEQRFILSCSLQQFLSVVSWLQGRTSWQRGITCEEQSRQGRQEAASSKQQVTSLLSFCPFRFHPGLKTINWFHPHPGWDFHYTHTPLIQISHP